MGSWRARGDGRPISFPAIPWHHNTEIVEQPPLEGWMASHPTLYYFACSCGVAGKGVKRRQTAERHADAHVAAA